MLVFVTGATGVMGRSTIRALQQAGHRVIGHARSASRAYAVAETGAEPFVGDYFDADSLTNGMRGCDAVCNLATHVPIGVAAALPRAWRANNRIRALGSKAVAEAARRADVGRVVQESISMLYADSGDEWITEDFPVEITGAAESAAVAESHAKGYAVGKHSSVVLRFGLIVGYEDNTTLQLKRAARGRPIGVEPRDGWCHIIHPDDLGYAVAASLTAPEGVYNVGAAPIRRSELNDEIAFAAGREEARYYGPIGMRFVRQKLELLTRSQRVSSQRFTEATGWKPVHEEFSADWLASRG